MKARIYIIIVAVLLTAVAKAGEVTAIWDYDFIASPKVDTFRVYAALGADTPFQAANTATTRVVNMVVGLQTRFIEDIQFTFTDLTPGLWRFTVTAVTLTGRESDQATPVSTMVAGEEEKPVTPQRLRL